jgi:hypothetical protein
MNTAIVFTLWFLVLGFFAYDMCNRIDKYRIAKREDGKYIVQNKISRIWPWYSLATPHDTIEDAVNSALSLQQYENLRAENKRLNKKAKIIKEM